MSNKSERNSSHAARPLHIAANHSLTGWAGSRLRRSPALFLRSSVVPRTDSPSLTSGRRRAAAERADDRRHTPHHRGAPFPSHALPSSERGGGEDWCGGRHRQAAAFVGHMLHGRSHPLSNSRTLTFTQDTATQWPPRRSGATTAKRRNSAAMIEARSPVVYQASQTICHHNPDIKRISRVARLPVREGSAPGTMRHKAMCVGASGIGKRY